MYITQSIDQARVPYVDGMVTVNRSRLRLNIIREGVASSSSNDGLTTNYSSAATRFFYQPKKMLPAPYEVIRVQELFKWPTPNTLMRKIWPKFPHSTWWRKARAIMVQRARYPNKKYLIAVLETLKRLWQESQDQADKQLDRLREAIKRRSSEYWQYGAYPQGQQQRYPGQRYYGVRKLPIFTGPPPDPTVSLFGSAHCLQCGWQTELIGWGHDIDSCPSCGAATYASRGFKRL